MAIRGRGLSYYPDTYLDVLRKRMENINQDSQRDSKDSNRTSPDYESRELDHSNPFHELLIT
jgi:hypothetical protein